MASPESTNGYVSPYADLSHGPASGQADHAKQAASIERWKQLLHMPPPAAHKEPRAAEQAPAEKQRKRLGVGGPPPCRLTARVMTDQCVEIRARQICPRGQDARLARRSSEAGRSGSRARYAVRWSFPAWCLFAYLHLALSQPGVIEVLGQLLDENPTTTWAYLCHPSIQHVSKLKREGKSPSCSATVLSVGIVSDLPSGGFCGYRNIQMLSSYIVGARAQGHEHFHRRIPSIFKIQDFIERAWDMGINARGRIETGGVKGSRKYIGTPEVRGKQPCKHHGGLRCSETDAGEIGTSHVSGSQHTVSTGNPPLTPSPTFRLKICRVRAMGFRDSQTEQAEARLMQHVLEYFAAAHVEGSGKVRRTSLPPIYFQHRGKRTLPVPPRQAFL